MGPGRGGRSQGWKLGAAGAGPGRLGRAGRRCWEDSGSRTGVGAGPAATWGFQGRSVGLGNCALELQKPSNGAGVGADHSGETSSPFLPLACGASGTTGQNVVAWRPLPDRGDTAAPEEGHLGGTACTVFPTLQELQIGPGLCMPEAPGLPDLTARQGAQGLREGEPQLPATAPMPAPPYMSGQHRAGARPVPGTTGESVTGGKGLAAPTNRDLGVVGAPRRGHPPGDKRVPVKEGAGRRAQARPRGLPAPGTQR